MESVPRHLINYCTVQNYDYCRPVLDTIFIIIWHLEKDITFLITPKFLQFYVTCSHRIIMVYFTVNFQPDRNQTRGLFLANEKNLPEPFSIRCFFLHAKKINIYFCMQKTLSLRDQTILRRKPKNYPSFNFRARIKLIVQPKNLQRFASLRFSIYLALILTVFRNSAQG